MLLAGLILFFFFFFFLHIYNETIKGTSGPIQIICFSIRQTTDYKYIRPLFPASCHSNLQRIDR